MSYFIDTLKESVYNPPFYHKVRGSSFKLSFKYFFKLILLISFVATVFFSVVMLPPLTALLSDENINRVIGYFPADLTLTMKKGELTTNGKEPIFIDIPQHLNQGAEHFIVIDTTSPVSLETFGTFKSSIWIAKTAIVTKSTSKTTIQSTATFPDFTLNRDKILSFVSAVRPFIKFIPVVAIVGIFAVLFSSYLFYLLYLLIFAFIVMFIAHVKKIELTYGESYRVALHAITLPLIIDLLLMLIPGMGGKIPFLFTAIATIVVIFNLQEPSVPASPMTESQA